MRIWVSSPCIEWNGYVYLREHMDIPTVLFWLEWHWTFYFTNFVICFERKYYLFPAWWWNLEAFITQENMLIRHLCEHDTNILFISAFKMAELYRFIQICPHVTSKKSIVFSSLLFSGRSINQPILMNIFFALRIFRKMQYRPYCFVTHHR